MFRNNELLPELKPCTMFAEPLQRFAFQGRFVSSHSELLSLLPAQPVRDLYEKRVVRVEIEKIAIVPPP